IDVPRIEPIADAPRSRDVRRALGADDDSARLPGDVRRIEHMIVVTMGDEDVIGLADVRVDRLRIGLRDRVVPGHLLGGSVFPEFREIRVHQDHDLAVGDLPAGIAQVSDLDGPPLGGARAGEGRARECQACQEDRQSTHLWLRGAVLRRFECRHYASEQRAAASPWKAGRVGRPAELMTQLAFPERASIDELRALQLERLRWAVHHAYQNVAHYRHSFDARGAHPDELRTLEDLAKFPFLEKRHFRDNYPFGLFAVPREKVVRLHASSGTTGRPTVVGYTQKDIDSWADLVARSIRAAGGRPGHIVHIAYGYGLFTGGLGAHY